MDYQIERDEWMYVEADSAERAAMFFGFLPNRCSDGTGRCTVEVDRINPATGMTIYRVKARGGKQS